MPRCTRYSIMLLILTATCDRLVVFSGYSGSSTNNTDRHDIAQILLKVALNTITLTLSLNNMVSVPLIILILNKNIIQLSRCLCLTFVSILFYNSYIKTIQKYRTFHSLLLFNICFLSCCYGLYINKSLWIRVFCFRCLLSFVHQ
jgi:hypothetical protein